MGFTRTSPIIDDAVAFASQCAKVANQLYDIAGKSKAAEASIRFTAEDCEALRLSWSRIGKWCQYWGEVDDALLRWLNPALMIGRMVISALEHDIYSFRSALQSSRLKRRPEATWNESIVRSHRDLLKGQVGDLSILLEAIKLQSANERAQLLRSKTPLLQVSGNSAWSMVPPQISRPLKEASLEERPSTSFEERSLEDDVSLMSIGSMEPLLQKWTSEKEPIVATINEQLDEKPPVYDRVRRHGNAQSLPAQVGQYDTWHLDLAAQQGRLDILEMILPIPTVKLDGWKKRQLADACRDGDKRLVRLLLENGADARAREAAGSYLMLGRTTLHLAALQGNVEIARLLIQCGASVNEIYTGYRTPLHEAASRGHSSITMLLLQKGATVDACDESRYRPLHAACMAGSYDVARLLLQRGANIHSVGNDFFQPIHHAAQDGGLPALISLLAANGADLEAQTPFHQRPLQLACQSQGASTVKALIQAGADPNAGVGDKPLQIACKSGAPEVVPVLLEAGADVDFGEGIGTGLDLNTPLGRAVYRRHVPIISMLLKRGANTNACNATGFTVLHMIAVDHGIPSTHFNVRERTEEALHILLEHGADSNATDDGGRTVFHYLAKFRISSTVDAMHVRNLASQFLNAGSDIDALNYDGDSPLDVAASTLEPGLVQILVENGARGIRPRTFESLAAFERLVRDEKSYDAGRILRYLRNSNLGR